MYRLWLNKENKLWSIVDEPSSPLIKPRKIVYLQHQVYLLIVVSLDLRLLESGKLCIKAKETKIKNQISWDDLIECRMCADLKRVNECTK